ncbi:MAG TPA: hypothetical protein VIM97_12975 [Actinomycetes bacterium]
MSAALGAGSGGRLLFGTGLLTSLPAILLIAFLAGRLLGVRRSLATTLLSGLVGWIVGTGLSLLIARGDPGAPGFGRNVWVFSIVFTMSAAVWVELLAKPGSLARAQQGLVRVPRPLRALRRSSQRVRRYGQITGIAVKHGFGPLLGLVLSTRADLLPAGGRGGRAEPVPGPGRPAPPDAVLDLLGAELERPVAEVLAELDPSRSWPSSATGSTRALQAGHGAAEQVVADLGGAAPGVGPDLVAGEAQDGVALGDQVAVPAALPHDLVGAGPDRAFAVDLDHDPGQDQEVDPVRADLAVRLDHGALGGVREPGGQPHAGQGALDPAEEAAGRRVGLGQQLDHGGTQGGSNRLRPSWCVVAASGDITLQRHSPARPVRA